MSSFSSESALSWLTWLQGAQVAFDALADVLAPDDYGFYELLHQQASRIAPVDACYFCLYRPSDNTLFFVYNFDGQFYDEPLTAALSNGPTSWVINHGSAFVLSEETRSIQHGNVQFGQHQRLSNAAIHLPVGVRDSSDGAAKPYNQIFGVFSIQSYQRDVYDAPTIAALQLLCDYVALHIQRQRERTESQRAQKALNDELRNHEAYKIRVANHVVELLQPVSRCIKTLCHLLARDAPSTCELRGQSVELSRLCSRLQTQVSQLPIDVRPLPAPLSASVSSAAPALAPDNPLRALSERELEVLHLAATGSSNEEIADALSCSIHTSKKHCTNIYRKLKVKGRTNAIHFYNRYAGSAKIILSDNQK